MLRTFLGKAMRKQITGIEPASSVWETEVMTTILYLRLCYNYSTFAADCQGGKMSESPESQKNLTSSHLLYSCCYLLAEAHIVLHKKHGGLIA